MKKLGIVFVVLASIILLIGVNGLRRVDGREADYEALLAA